LTLPWSTKLKALVQPLDNGFVLDLKGHKVVALKLPSRVAAGIAGGEFTPEGLLSRLKGKIHASENEQWLALTSIENPLLEDYESFGMLIAQSLTEASGLRVGKSDLTIAASIRI
jgi:hypothetical protein